MTPGAWLFEKTKAMADEPNEPQAIEPQTVSLRPSHLTCKRLERLKVKLDTRSTSEIVRRALQHFERCHDAEAMWIQEEGEKQRVFLD